MGLEAGPESARRTEECTESGRTHAQNVTSRHDLEPPSSYPRRSTGPFLES